MKTATISQKIEKNKNKKRKEVMRGFFSNLTEKKKIQIILKFYKPLIKFFSVIARLLQRKKNDSNKQGDVIFPTFNIS